MEIRREIPSAFCEMSMQISPRGKISLKIELSLFNCLPIFRKWRSGTKIIGSQETFVDMVSIDETFHRFTSRFLVCFAGDSR